MAKLCKNCGAWPDDNDKFCQHCGADLREDDVPVVVDVEPEIVDAEIIQPPKRCDSPAADAREVRERLIGTKTEYYLPRFEKMENLNSFTDWNWCAFLVSNAWMMYRKMYVYGAIAWALFFVMGLLEVPALLSLIVYIGTGVLGNYLYMKDINNRTEKAMNMQPEEREIFIQKNSGTSWVPVIIMCAVSIVLNSIFY